MGTSKRIVQKIRDRISKKEEGYGNTTNSNRVKALSSLDEAIQDIFARFVQELYNLRLDNYLKIKNVALDQVEIIQAYFHGKDEYFLKKLVLTLFIPFLYVHMNNKERDLAEGSVTNLYLQLEDLRSKIAKGDVPRFAFREVILKDQVEKERINEYLEEKAKDLDDEGNLLTKDTEEHA